MTDNYDLLLYPPIMDTYLPTFCINEGTVSDANCKVYFSLSSYNKRTDIKAAIVNLTYQNNNMSAFSNDFYPNGVMVVRDEDIKKDLSSTIDDIYYIEISPSDLKAGFELNKYYKVQVRFSSVEAPEQPITAIGQQKQSYAQWLSENLKKFSEWSTVGLLRGIAKPMFHLRGMNNDNFLETNTLFRLSGNLTFETGNPKLVESDVLKSYTVKLFNADLRLLEYEEGVVLDKRELIEQSDLLYANINGTVNDIGYLFKKRLEPGRFYYLEIEAETMSGYEFLNTYYVVTTQDGEDTIEGEILTETDEENGLVKIFLNTSTPLNRIVWQRTSSESNFSIWEDVFVDEFELPPVNGELTDDYGLISKDGEYDEHAEAWVLPQDSIYYTWIDNTVKSGVWYKYSVSIVDQFDVRGVPLETEEPVIIFFENVFLNSDDRSFKVCFNHKINSYKPVVMDSNSTTLGSKYPFITRNSAVDYKEFQLNGLVSALSNEDEYFITEMELYGSPEVKELYKKYNEDNRINQYNDYILERRFREEAEKYLKSGKVMLFKSLTEGNMLVRLTDVALTPDESLGRYMYSFSAKVSECDDCTLENIKKYGIASFKSVKGGSEDEE